MGFLSGGSKQKSRSTSTSTSNSSNQAYGFLQNSLGDLVGSAGQGTSAINSLLGLGGDSGEQMDAFNRYKEGAGYNFAFDEGQRAITGNMASKGLLNSGSALKALTSFGQNIGNQYFNQYLDRLFQSSNQGFNAAQILSGAGGTSSSTGNSNSTSSGQTSSGIGSLIGPIASAIAASDRRLKSNIRKIGKLANGLPVYSFTYINTGEQTMGVMADEVREAFPEALGPRFNGYDTVDYAKLLQQKAA